MLFVILVGYLTWSDCEYIICVMFLNIYEIMWQIENMLLVCEMVQCGKVPENLLLILRFKKTILLLRSQDHIEENN